MVKPVTPGPSSNEQRAIDRVCDEFENAWKSGREPKIDEYAQRLAPEVSLPGLIELVILDSFYRRRTGSGKVTGGSPTHQPGRQVESLTWNSYVQQFPVLETVPVPAEFESNESIQRTLGDRYRLLHAHASGGLGRVSAALDIPFGRTVAIKEMHPRFVQDAAFRKRFLREAVITSRLEHPGIVPVYEMGDRKLDEPWYAMRMVQGRSMLEAIRICHDQPIDNVSQQFDRRKLLNRFVDVCHAVEYAHQNGVIHRDIKPDNIMLGDFGETLLIDWGLAVRLDEQPDPETATASRDLSMDRQTVAGTVMGTPQYMSPEQSSPESDSVDHLSDVYALGATLYHIIVGHPPVWTGSNSTRNPPSQFDGLSAAKAEPSLRAICQRAMAIDSTQRYQSAAALAAEIELYLADQPVAAYSDPVWTRGRRWLKNHRALASASLVATALGIVGLIVFSMLSQVHANSLTIKNQQLDALVVSEQQQRQAAERSEKRTGDAMAYLVQALRSPDPYRDGREIKVVDILDQAIEQLETDFVDDPLLKAQMLSAFGRTFLGLGKFAEAQPLVEQAREIYTAELGTNDRLTLSAGDQLAEVYYMLGDPAAGELITDVVESSRKHLGETDPDTLRFRLTAAEQMRISGKAKQAVAEFESVLPEYEKLFGVDGEPTLTLMNNLAVAYKDAGLAADAVQTSKLVYEKRLETLGPDSAKTIGSGSNYAVHLGATTNRKMAGPLHEQFLAAAREKWGDTHHRTLVYINRLGTSLIAENNLARAIPLLRELFETSTSLYGPTHTVTLNAENTLAIAYLNAADYENAATRFKALHELSLKENGPDHKRTLTYANNLGVAYRNTNNHDGAIELLRTTLASQQKSLGPEHPDSLRTMLNLASTMQTAKRFADSIPVCRQALQLASDHHGPDYGHAQTAQSLEAMAHLELKDFQSAKSVLQAGLESRTRTIPDHWLRYNTMSLLGEACLGLHEFDEAEPLLLESYQKMLEQQEKIPARAHNRIDQARERLVRLYEAKNQPEEARRYRSVK